MSNWQDFDFTTLILSIPNTYLIFINHLHRGKKITILKRVTMAMIAVEVVVEKLVTLLEEEAQFLVGVRRGVSELRDDLESMRSFLQNAESRTETEKGVETWV
ncbi:hypothetical protein RHMOL_Rhmol09G0040900 [Rhododendron molle]|uniref:Uncharacterized protein n=1 Tax=Rhododendron molle TaxID=49168 RepID=A0ACC0M9M2_RHOML|nr:hypothetical protein RHMOL_Rhmol09G0040900 [Rhododendron molle]